MTFLPAQVLKLSKLSVLALERQFAQASDSLRKLRAVARDGRNIFEGLLTTVRYCSLGQISNALYEVTGQHRRSMKRPPREQTERGFQPPFLTRP